MYVPTIQGMIERRLLINYRIDPDVMAALIPSPFSAKIVEGYAMAGICLIRLKNVRPCGFPKAIGLGSENAAHRIAVKWDDCGKRCEGVYIPRRDTSSRFNAAVGGRLFPGTHHHARFQSVEHDGRYCVTLNSDDGHTHLSVDAHTSDALPGDSVFPSLGAASAFFQQGSIGYSASGRAAEFDGLELRSNNWHVTPLIVKNIASNFFDNQDWFPVGSIRLDSALLMTQVEHEWHARPPIRAK